MAAPTGRRTVSLFKAACVAGELIGGGEIDRPAAEAALKIVAGTREIDDADRQIRRGIQRGLRNPRNPNLTGGRNITSATEARIVIFEWTENLDARGTDRRICTAIGQHCWNVGTTTVDLSYREVAEACGMSVGTVANHAGRLGRWVRVVRHGRRFRANDNRTRWRLIIRENRAKSEQAEGHPLYGVGGLFSNGTSLRDPAADPWHRWSSGWTIWSLLDLVDPITVSELVVLSGYSRRTIYRNLSRLGQVDLVEQSETGWIRCDRELAEFSIQAERKERHRLERERHTEFLQSRYESREAGS